MQYFDAVIQSAKELYENFEIWKLIFPWSYVYLHLRVFWATWYRSNETLILKLCEKNAFRDLENGLSKKDVVI